MSLLDEPMNERIFQFKTVTVEKGMKYKERSFCNKIGRFIYCTFRMAYVGFIFYFNPFLPLIYYYIETDYKKLECRYIIILDQNGN